MNRYNSINPNEACAKDSGIFGLTFTFDDAALIYLPVPWEVTTSYGAGTANAPAAILQASYQVDLFDLEITRPYEAGLFILPESEHIRKWNVSAKSLLDQNREEKSAIELANQLGEKLNYFVLNETKKIIAAHKIPAIIGGDHSVPFGAFQAIAESYSSFGILHIDAHLDMRCAYENLKWSHASIMYNALENISAISHITQVGIRDFCEEEFEYAKHIQQNRVSVFFDSEIAQEKMQGIFWKKITEKIISTLPEFVWISFDIDGLDPRFCPNTGTPVPGGLEFNEAIYLISALVRSGRKIIGFDLNEVAPGKNNEWDANVAARLLYKLSAWTLASQGKVLIN